MGCTSGERNENVWSQRRMRQKISLSSYHPTLNIKALDSFSHVYFWVKVKWVSKGIDWFKRGPNGTGMSLSFLFFSCYIEYSYSHACITYWAVLWEQMKLKPSLDSWEMLWKYSESYIINKVVVLWKYRKIIIFYHGYVWM